MTMITDSTSRALEQALDRRLERQQLLASNIANVDTPNFKPMDMEFEGALRDAMGAPTGGLGPMDSTHAHHMNAMNGAPAADTSIIERVDVANTLDGNGVDLDQEMARYADNSIRYNATLEMVRRRHGILTYTIMKASGG
jgi:flagellar basal-body rod protein FlgB